MEEKMLDFMERYQKISLTVINCMVSIVLIGLYFLQWNWGLINDFLCVGIGVVMGYNVEFFIKHTKLIKETKFIVNWKEVFAYISRLEARIIPILEIIGMTCLTILFKELQIAIGVRILLNIIVATIGTVIFIAICNYSEGTN